MTKTIYLLIPVVAILLAPVCTAADDPEATLKETRMLLKQADELQGAWTSTEDLIKKAEEALAKEDKKTAVQLANKAKAEAQASVMQAKEQLKNWSEPPYIRQ